MLKSLESLAIIASIVLVLSLVGLAYLSSPPSGHPREQQATAQPRHEDQNQEQHSVRGFIRYLFPDGIAVFTFWLVIATIVLGAVAIIQIGFLERAETISAQSAKAAKDAAEATQAAVQLSDKTAKRQLRAYISPRGGAVMNFGIQNPIEAVVFLKNNGQTPAYDFQSTGVLIDSAFPLVDALPEAQNSTGMTVLGPGTEYAVRLKNYRIATEPELASLRAGDRALYLYGAFTYRDAFGDIHNGKFRLFYGGKTGAIPGGEMSFYESGNEGD